MVVVPPADRGESIQIPTLDIRPPGDHYSLLGTPGAIIAIGTL